MRMITEEMQNAGWQKICDYITDHCPKLVSDRNATLVIDDVGDWYITEWLGNTFMVSTDRREEYYYHFVREGDMDPAGYWTSYEDDELVEADVATYLDDHEQSFINDVSDHNRECEAFELDSSISG